MTKKYAGPLLALPALVLLLFVLILPIGFTIYCSLFKCNYLQFSAFIGLENYIKIFEDPTYVADFGRTFYVSIVALIVAMLIGTLLALWIHKSGKVLSYSLQMIGLIPWVTSMVVAALLWKWLLDPDLGLANYVLKMLGLEKQTLLTDINTSIYAVILVIAWRTVGYAMVMILAGLKMISIDILEAAKVDGCNSFHSFRYVKLPMMKTSFLITAICLTLSNFNNLTVPYTLTGGGPGISSNVVSISVYRLGFVHYRFGLASAFTFLMLLFNIVLVVIYVKAVRYEI